MVPSLQSFEDRGTEAHVYAPAEDTFLLLDALQDQMELLAGLRPCVCVEVGPGSGAVSVFLASHLHTSLVLAVDVNRRACEAALDTAADNGAVAHRFEAVCGDLLRPLRGRADVIIFNPPYVPTPSSEVGVADVSAAWAGGLDGREVIDRFVPLLGAHLTKPLGCAYLVVVDANRPAEIARMAQALGLTTRVIATRRAFNERLSILKFSWAATDATNDRSAHHRSAHDLFDDACPLLV